MSEKIDRPSPQHDERKANARGPLPEAWLPRRSPPAGDPAWEGPLHRILAAAEPELARRTADSRATNAPSRETARGTALLPDWVEFGGWWKPAVAVAAVAAALLFVVERPRASEGPNGIALSLIATEGDPIALWSALGVPADPILAYLAFEDHDAFLAGDRTPTSGDLR